MMACVTSPGPWLRLHTQEITEITHAFLAVFSDSGGGSLRGRSSGRGARARDGRRDPLSSAVRSRLFCSSFRFFFISCACKPDNRASHSFSRHITHKRCCSRYCSRRQRASRPWRQAAPAVWQVRYVQTVLWRHHRRLRQLLTCGGLVAQRQHLDLLTSTVTTLVMACLETT